LHTNLGRHWHKKYAKIRIANIVLNFPSSLERFETDSLATACHLMVGSEEDRQATAISHRNCKPRVRE